MAFLVKEKRQQADYVNYEQQAPNRDIHYRQANMGGYQQPYYPQDQQPQYNEYYSQQYTQPQYAQPQYSAQPAPQYVASFYQNQADRYVASGYIPPQQSFDNNQGYSAEEQYRQDMYVNQNYDYRAQAKRISKSRSGKMKQKNVNADMIKIVVTVMVVALLICGLLIANQFISGSEAAAEDLPQAIDSQLIASAATDSGSAAMKQIDTLPAYEYEQSTNWFDKVCDFFGGKLN